MSFVKHFKIVNEHLSAKISDDKITIPAGETYALNGAIYTAIIDAQLTLDFAEKIFGTQREPLTTGRKRVNLRVLETIFDLKEFIASVERPRKIVLMLLAGKPLDSMIEPLAPASLSKPPPSTSSPRLTAKTLRSKISCSNCAG